MLISIVLLFIICWLPRIFYQMAWSIDYSFDVGILETFGGELTFDNQRKSSYLRLFSYVNSCVNVAIYALTSR